MYFAGDFSMTTFQLHRASPVLCPMAYNFVSAELVCVALDGDKKQVH